MIRPSPAVGYAIRSLFGWRSQHWRAVAVENWELAPAETRDNPSPLCIEGQMEKARHLDHGWNTDNIESLSATTITQKATTAHLLKHVTLAGTSLFSGRMHHLLSDAPPSLMNRDPIEHIAAGVLASAHSGNKWFGHFIWDTSPLTLMAADVAGHRAMEVVAAPMVTDKLGQRLRYLEILSIKPRMLSLAHFEQIVLIDPLGFNAYHRAKMRELRRRIRSAVNPLFRDHRVYLRRGTLGEPRNALNESQIEDQLSKHGFHILDPENMSLDLLVASLLGAKLVVGIEGSHLAHAILSAADGATLLTLQPPHRFAAALKMRSEHIGMRWGFLIGQRRGEKTFVIDAEELQRTLDMLP